MPGLMPGPPLPNPVYPAAVNGFYIKSGVKLRNITQFEFHVVDRNYTREELGRPPFGPLTDGEFGTGVGKPGYNDPAPPANFTNNEQGYPYTPDWGNCAAPPRLSGIWQYNDGYLNPNPGPLCGSSATSFWVGSDIELGRYRAADPVPPPDPPVPTPPYQYGEFELYSPTLQLNAGTFSGSNTVTFEYLIDGNYDARYGIAPDSSGEIASLIYSAYFAAQDARGYSNKIWTPTIEVGFQAGNFFDFFYGFSWYSLGHGFGNTVTQPTPMSVRGFRDAWPFFSDDVSGIPGAVFNSSVSIVGGNELGNINYLIHMDTAGQNGSFPTRTFFLADYPGGGDENIQEVVFHRADLGIYENRFGARSWAPIFGLGRIGATAGLLVTPIHYQMSTTTLVTSEGPNLPAGTVMYSSNIQNRDWWWNFGGFIGADIEIGLPRYYFSGSVEYSLCKREMFQQESVETFFNPGGFAATFGGGIRF
jgi:hypothetical protein